MSTERDKTTSFFDRIFEKFEENNPRFFKKK